MAQALDAISLEQPDHIDWDMLASDRGISVQRRQPSATPEPAHFHPSIEINFLIGCDMTYSFSGDEVEIPRERFCIFWAAHPHSNQRVHETGIMTNIYVSLSEFLQWSLPAGFVNAILSGSVLATKAKTKGDVTFAKRLADERDNPGLAWQRLHAQEVSARLARMALEGWDTLRTPPSSVPPNLIGGNAIYHFEKMLRFVAVHFVTRITIADVAASAGVSQSYAVSLFSKLLGRTIMEHIRDMRIVHAKMLLIETDQKILTIAMDCGFGSLSSFYECFQNYVGVSPAAFRKNPNQTLGLG